jgi:hypothetical protein
MPFPWLHRTPPRKDGAQRRDEVAASEVASRAGLLFRLGFSQAAATKRLCERVAWEYDPRPAALSDQAIGTIVSATYARRPG